MATEASRDPERGLRIKELRRRRGYLSAKALADAMGIHHRTVQNWEVGRAIDSPNLGRLAEVLGVTPGHIWAGEDDDGAEGVDPIVVLRRRVDALEGRFAQEDGERAVALRAHDKRVTDELAQIKERIEAGADAWARILTELRQLRLAVDELRAAGATGSRSGTAP